MCGTINGGQVAPQTLSDGQSQTPPSTSPPVLQSKPRTPTPATVQTPVTPAPATPASLVLTVIATPPVSHLKPPPVAPILQRNRHIICIGGGRGLGGLVPRKLHSLVPRRSRCLSTPPPSTPPDTTPGKSINLPLYLLTFRICLP
ncbi:hypothetical protein J6590_022532 [Homalodisca vitripennis]|nr:hypothetical protein J6590_022532 [Homalodisca vitripennis]